MFLIQSFPLTMYLEYIKIKQLLLEHIIYFVLQTQVLCTFRSRNKSKHSGLLKAIRLSDYTPNKQIQQRSEDVRKYLKPKKKKSFKVNLTIDSLTTKKKIKRI